MRTVLILGAMLLTKNAGPTAKADLVLINGNVVTQDPAKPKAQSIAVIGDKIVLVGGTDEVKALTGAKTEIWDLAGATVLPGLVDAHAHVHDLGEGLSELDFTGTTSAQQVADMVAVKAKGAAKGSWIKGNGWDQNDWALKEFPAHALLDAAAPDVPVVLSRVDGHATWLNAKALALSGITKATADPKGGKILRDAQGEPTGVLVDDAMALAKVPEESLAEVKADLLAAQAEIEKNGLTGVHDMGVRPVWLQAYRELLKEKKLTFRAYAFLSTKEPKFTEEWLAKKPERGAFFGIAGFKMFADGALGSRGAHLAAPYADDPGNTGLVIQSGDEIEKLTERALKNGWQVCVHAIGDQGNHDVLDAYEKALAATGAKDARLRVEHAQVVMPGDLPRFAKLGVIASMQPTHATSDMPWAESRVGPERIKGAYAWHTLLASGARICAGSDFPVEGVSPLRGFYAAITRQDAQGNPKGGWRPEEKMTREQALAAFTTEAAYAAFETDRGVIAPGKLADLTILSADVMTIPPEEILTTKVVGTVVGGRVVYRVK
jgi:predicted amidohydrolase YtcJ